MYYKTDESGNYLGVKSEKNEGWEFFSTTPLPNDIARVRNDNGVWVNAEIDIEIEAPQIVPMWCLRVILTEMELFDSVIGAIEQLEEPNKTRAKTIIEYGNNIHRDSQTVSFIGMVLNKTDKEIDEIFINADKINL